MVRLKQYLYPYSSTRGFLFYDSFRDQHIRILRIVWDAFHLKRTRPGRREEDLGQNTTARLVSKFNPICKYESDMRHNLSMAFLSDSKTPLLSELKTTKDWIRPDVLSLFCGHELCPTSSSDFGCLQTRRCLCFLRNTRHLPLSIEAENQCASHLGKEPLFLVHTLWLGNPFSSVISRMVESFRKTQRSDCVRLIVWFVTNDDGDFSSLRRSILLDKDQPRANSSNFACAIDKTAETNVEVCQLTLGKLASFAIGTPFEGKQPVMRNNEKSVLSHPKPLSDFIRFVLLARFGGLYLDVDSILLRDITPAMFAMPFFSSFWGVQAHFNTGAVLRMKKYRNSSSPLDASSHLFEELVRSASSSKKGKSKEQLLLPNFHPRAVTKVAAQLKLLREKSHEFTPLTLAFFEPAWCQPQNDQNFPIPSISELHEALTISSKDSAPTTQLFLSADRRTRVFESGAFALHYHRAGESG